MDLRIENLSVRFKDFSAVKDLNIEIKSGELVSLLGPSGFGKSTTIFTIAGIHKPSEGHIYFDEKVIDDIAPEKRNIGMVFQNYALYPHMSVYDNIAFPLKLKKLPKKEIKDKVHKISSLVKIEELLKRKPSQLSGGQQQRVAIARALVKEPEILLLDEPLSNLDARLRVEMREEIKRIQSELKITTIFVTHDQEEAMSISDKIVLLKDGVLQQYDLPSKLYKNPKNLFVGSFLGNPPINIIHCDVNKKEDSIRLFNKDFKLSNFINTKCISQDTRDVKIGIRCEDFIVSEKYFDDSIEANIEFIENLGKDTILKIKVGDTAIKVVTTYDTIPDKMTNVYIGIKPNRLVFFDSKTGDNLSYD